MKSHVLVCLFATVVVSLAPLRAAPSTNAPAADAGSEYRDYGVLLYSDLVVAGEIKSGGREVARSVPTSEGTLYYYYYPFKVSDVIKGTAPSAETLEVATVWSGGKGDPLFLKTGDKRILFLQKPTKERPVWLVASRTEGVQALNPQRVASIKRFIADGPPPPFSAWRQANSARPSTLDVRISVVTNVIAPVSRRLTNGRTDVLELPICIENASTQTITASLAHEWFGGIWPPTDLGAAAQRSDDESASWRTSAAYLSGELGIETEPTIWEPGQRHTFVLRLNWPGTGSMHGLPLVDANQPGHYVVRVSLVFKAGETAEYAASPPMKVDVQSMSGGK